ncbi:hypothetical protein ACJX0J_013625, partial [Zea mays]
AQMTIGHVAGRPWPREMLDMTCQNLIAKELINFLGVTAKAIYIVDCSIKNVQFTRITKEDLNFLCQNLIAKELINFLGVTAKAIYIVDCSIKNVQFTRITKEDLIFLKLILKHLLGIFLSFLLVLYSHGLVWTSDTLFSIIIDGRLICLSEILL